jgi:hypothetical protein
MRIDTSVQFLGLRKRWNQLYTHTHPYGLTELSAQHLNADYTAKFVSLVTSPLSSLRTPYLALYWFFQAPLPSTFTYKKMKFR